MIEKGDTVYFNTVDKGTVLGEAEDGRIRIESWEKNANATPARPWKIIWLIPAGLLRKESAPEEPIKSRAKPTNRGCCNR